MSIVGAAEGLRRQLVKLLPIVCGELAYMPKAPTIRDVGHLFLSCICSAQFTPDAIQSVGNQKCLGCHAKSFGEGIFKCTLAYLRSPANVSDTNVFVGELLDICLSADQSQFAPTGDIRRGYPVGGSNGAKQSQRQIARCMVDEVLVAEWKAASNRIAKLVKALSHRLNRGHPTANDARPSTQIVQPAQRYRIAN